MNCKYKDIGYSASAMQREIIMMAGEWLERANLRRGRNINEDEIEYLEGAPEKYQPKKEPIILTPVETQQKPEVQIILPAQVSAS